MPPDPAFFWQATIAAALLRQGRWLTRLSLGLVVVALAGAMLAAALMRPLWALPGALSLPAGFTALWLGIRAAFDADLFAALAQNPDFPGFDRAMSTLDLMPSDRAGRALDLRIAGALRLQKHQGIACGIQIAALVFGTVLVALVK